MATINQLKFNGSAYDLGAKGENVNGAVASTTKATQLKNNAGSSTQPIYFSNGKPVNCTYSLSASVPSNAKFTDTTYSAATQSAAGLMSAADKTKLDGVTASADTISFSRSLTSGTKVGTITINGAGTDLYCQTNTDTDTHWTSGIYTGASGTATNAAVANPYIKVTDNNTYRNQIRLIGSGATTVASDASGNITISSTDTNTTYSVNTLYPTAFSTPAYAFTMGSSGYSGGGGYSTIAELRAAMNVANGANTFSMTKYSYDDGCRQALKFSDGTLICMIVTSFNCSYTTAWGKLWETPDLTLPNWAYTFASPPVVVGCVFANVNTVNAGADQYCWAMLEAVGGTTATRPGVTCLARPNQMTRWTHVVVMGIGRWK